MFFTNTEYLLQNSNGQINFCFSFVAKIWFLKKWTCRKKWGSVACRKELFVYNDKNNLWDTKRDQRINAKNNEQKDERSLCNQVYSIKEGVILRRSINCAQF